MNRPYRKCPAPVAFSAGHPGFACSFAVAFGGVHPGLPRRSGPRPRSRILPFGATGLPTAGGVSPCGRGTK